MAQVSDMTSGENKRVSVNISWFYNVCPMIDLILGLIISKSVSHTATDIYKCAFVCLIHWGQQFKDSTFCMFFNAVFWGLHSVTNILLERFYYVESL